MMKEVNLSLDSGRKDKETGEVIHSVICTAKFATLEEAVRFHAAAGDLCRNSVPRNSEPWSFTRARLAIASQRE